MCKDASFILFPRFADNSPYRQKKLNIHIHSAGLFMIFRSFFMNVESIQFSLSVFLICDVCAVLGGRESDSYFDCDYCP